MRELEATLASVNQRLGQLDGIITDFQSTSGEVAVLSQALGAQSGFEMLASANAALAAFSQVMAESRRCPITWLVRETAA